MAYARLPDKDGCPPHYWMIILDQDDRFQVAQYTISYFDASLSPFQGMILEQMGESPPRRLQPVTKEQRTLVCWNLFPGGARCEISVPLEERAEITRIASLAAGRLTGALVPARLGRWKHADQKTQNRPVISKSRPPTVQTVRKNNAERMKRC